MCVLCVCVYISREGEGKEEGMVLQWSSNNWGFWVLLWTWELASQNKLICYLIQQKKPQQALNAINHKDKN